jgi:1,4-dihydroxy-6-naphthoate synthase
LKLSLGFSPCPNDTFIFDALVHNKIDTKGFSFDVHLEDVQTLNQWALQGKLDCTKLSYGVLPLVLDKYSVLNSGSALGKGVGPLLIKNEKLIIKNIENELIAIPGENTTAHLLFSLAYPNAKNKVFLRYDEIENFVLDNKGLGVIIHENRFTYEEKGLKKIVDLGDYWETQTNNPIPLGGIVIDKKIDNKIALQIDSLIKQSIEYAYANHYNELSLYVKQYAQEMSETVMKQHIDLYVNNYSLQLGQEGKQAIAKLIAVYEQMSNLKINTSSIFV